jgi:hypothetical protein
MKSRFLKIVILAATATAIAAPAMAASVLDLTSVGTAITSELTPALAAAMPIAGTLIAVGVGWKFFRRFVK